MYQAICRLWMHRSGVESTQKKLGGSGIMWVQKAWNRWTARLAGVGQGRKGKQAREIVVPSGMWGQTGQRSK